MNTRFDHDQRILQNARAAPLGPSIIFFLIDRQAEGLTKCSVRFYRQNLHPFHTYCNDNSIELVQDITPELLRRYFLNLAKTHNPAD